MAVGYMCILVNIGLLLSIFDSVEAIKALKQASPSCYPPLYRPVQVPLPAWIERRPVCPILETSSQSMSGLSFRF